MRRTGSISLFFLVCTACGGAPRDDEPLAAGTDASAMPSGDAGDEDDVEPPADGEGSGEGSDGDDDVRLDVGPPDGGTGLDPDAGPGCSAVDFLFVVDSSGSMYAHQQNLIANFGTFIDGIESTLDDVDTYHVGVVTSDAYEWNDPACGEIGELVVQTRLPDGSAPVCGPYGGGRNYMTDGEDLEDAFSCAAQVGIHGDTCERPMEALVRAVDGTHAEPGGCNEGFLREDSLLVVVILTDEWDGPDEPELPYCQPSAGSPNEWFDAVVEARGGIESNIAVLSLVNWEESPGAGPCPPCGSIGCDPVYDTRHVQTFTEMFTHGFMGGLCVEDYGDYFAEAVDVVESACSSYTPVG